MFGLLCEAQLQAILRKADYTLESYVTAGGTAGFSPRPISLLLGRDNPSKEGLLCMVTKKEQNDGTQNDLDLERAAYLSGVYCR